MYLYKLPDSLIPYTPLMDAHPEGTRVENPQILFDKTRWSAPGLTSYFRTVYPKRSSLQ